MTDGGELSLFPENPEEGEQEAAGREPEVPEADEDGREPEVASEPEGPRVWRVSQVNRAVKRLLEETLQPLWVSGEVANWKRVRSGHCYFTLKDENAQLRSVLFRPDASRLPIDPEDGMEVRVWGNLTLYEARGEYQFVGRRLEAMGEEGLWRIAFDRLRGKLDAEGLTAPGRKRPLPRHPRSIGIVTSTTGAALRDILSVLRRRAPWVRVYVRGSRVQGEGASTEVADAIRSLVEAVRPDLLIVGRGGGSIEDLWAFNEEPVARAIAACPVPVISAVGHETDVTIADLVADLRAPTPSAAAEAAVPDAEQIIEALAQVRPRMRRAVRSAVDRRRRAVSQAPGRLTTALRRRVGPLRDRMARALARAELGVRRVIRDRRSRVAVEPRLERAIRGRVQTARAELRTAAGRLDALSPLATLERGYAVPLGADGAVLRRASDFERNDEFELRVVDGRVVARTLDIRTEETADS